MSIRSWWRKLVEGGRVGSALPLRSRRRRRPQLEILEERCVPILSRPAPFDEMDAEPVADVALDTVHQRLDADTGGLAH